MGAEIHGYALDPPTNPSLFRLAQVAELLKSNMTMGREGQYTDYILLNRLVESFRDWGVTAGVHRARTGSCVNPKLVVNRPIEDMAPHWDRDELASEMLIDLVKDKTMTH